MGHSHRGDLPFAAIEDDVVETTSFTNVLVN